MQTDFPEPRYFVCSLTIQAAKRLVAHYNRVLAPVGITAQQMIALGVLWRHGRLSLGAFSRRAGMGKAAAVTMVRRLEAMGLVSREEDPTDARLNALVLTSKARELAPVVAGKVRDLERSLEQALGKEELQTLVRALMDIRALDLEDPARHREDGHG
ncbi:MAG: MarR family winged helix-turn-helix transcriptional regulator [Desulfobacteraceae bacterium]|jgi:DNA-binding MarR family transcriptional regulator